MILFLWRETWRIFSFFFFLFFLWKEFLFSVLHKCKPFGRDSNPRPLVRQEVSVVEPTRTYKTWLALFCLEKGTVFVESNGVGDILWRPTQMPPNDNNVITVKNICPVDHSCLLISSSIKVGAHFTISMNLRNLRFFFVLKVFYCPFCNIMEITNIIVKL